MSAAKSISRYSTVLLALVLLAWQAPVWSQAEVNLPPRQDTKSATGVSYKSGSFALDGMVDLSIGGEGLAGLQLRRIYGSALSPAVADNTNTQGWTFNTVAQLSRTLMTYEPGVDPPPNHQFIPMIYTVSTGSKSVSFKANQTSVPPTDYTPISPGGETLVFTRIGTGGSGSGSYHTFTDSDGSVYAFPWFAQQARLASVSYPDGTTLDFTYTTAPTGNKVTKSIISNRGYAILFDGPTKACIVNRAETFIDATSTCPIGAQSITYSYTTSTFNSGVQNLTGATDILGQTTTYEYVGADHLGCIKEPGQSICKISNTYNVCVPPPDPPVPENLRYSDQVISQTTGTGETYSYDYQFVGAYTYCSDFSGFGANTTMVSPGNATTLVSTNGAGMPIGITDPLNRITGLGYYDNSIISWEQATPYSQIDPEGNSQTVTRDARANVIEKHILAKPGSGLAEQMITASYPATCANPKTCNKPDYVIDAKGNRTDYTYDSNHGGILTETRSPDANGVRPQKRFSYTQLYAWIKDSSGGYVPAGASVWMLTGISECMTLSACSGTADEIKTTITYGTPGTANNLLPTVTTTSSGDNVLVAVTAKAYDSAGNVLTVDGPLAGSADTIRYRYDALRRVIGVIGSDPDDAGPLAHRATRNTYDPAGRLIKVEQGTVYSQSDADWTAFSSLEVVDTVYDVMGRVLKVSKSGDGVVYTVAQNSYDASGQLECTAVRMDSAQWNSQINACVPQTTGPHGPDRISRNFYNAAGERITRQLGVGTVDQSDEETYTYTPNGKSETVKDGENNLTRFAYDGFDRLSKTSYPVTAQGAQTSSLSDYEELTYDANSNVTARRLRDGKIINSTYDALNRPTVKDLPSPEVDVGYSYDLQGRALLSTQGGAYVSLTYNALGHLVSEVTDQGVISYTHDVAGRRTHTTWSDGFFVYQEYLTTGEVTVIRENGTTSGALALASYGYDQLGRRTSITRGNGTVSSFGYDAISRLQSQSQNLSGATHDVSSVFAFNPASQIVSWVRDNDAFIYTGHANQNKAYGVNGLNQLTTAGSTSIAYDARGNLTGQGSLSYGYTAENRLISGPGGSVFSYDPVGRLAQSSGSTENVRFQYDGTDLVAEYNTSNILLRRFVHGPGADEPLVWYEGSGTTDRRWFHQDERGSIVALSNSAGNTLHVNSYDEYGIPASSNLGRFQYTGQTWMPDVGMYYYKARVYSPTLGRFLQTDPIGYKDGINWYAYVGNDPVNRLDPNGREKLEIPTGTHIPVKPQGNPQRTTQGGVDTGHAKASENIMAERQQAAVDRGAKIDSASYHRSANAATNGAVPSKKMPDGTLNTTEASGAKQTEFLEVERDPAKNPKTQAKLNNMPKPIDGRAIKTTIKNFAKGTGKLLPGLGAFLTGMEIRELATNPQPPEEQGPMNCLCD